MAKSAKMSKTLATFQVGNQVRIRTAGRDGTIWEITKLLPHGECMIREEGLAPNGKPYAEQHFHLSLLRHMVSDEMLKAFSLPGLKAGRKNWIGDRRRS